MLLLDLSLLLLPPKLLVGDNATINVMRTVSHIVFELSIIIIVRRWFKRKNNKRKK